MIYKIWLKNFENWIFPGHLKKGDFFTFYLKKNIFLRAVFGHEKSNFEVILKKSSNDLPNFFKIFLKIGFFLAI